MSELYRIKFTDDSFISCGEVQPISCNKTFRGTTREALLITTTEDYSTIVSRFIDDIRFSVMAYEETLNVSGLPSREYEWIEYPKSDYIIAGDITDKRDGTVTILMGKKTAIELLEEENAALLFENLTGEDF